MFTSIIELGLVALLPSVFAGIFTLLIKKNVIKNPSKIWVQIIIGIVFGLIAVAGTEFGIPMNGAQVNCRDAAALTAGLFFGAPAGIIAGLIGGIERWFAVYWGIGTFTRVACTVSTIIAGLFSAFLRKVMFEDKKSGAIISLAIGIVAEVMHMMMVFLTNMNTPEKAISVVKSCATIMITANGISVMIAALVVRLVIGKPFRRESKKVGVSQTIQKGLLVTVIFAFIGTTIFVVLFQNKMMNTQTDSLLSLAIDETSTDISDMSDTNLLQIANKVKDAIKVRDLDSIMQEYDLAEIDIVNDKGVIEKSSDKSHIGFRLADNLRTGEFLCLLENKEEYVQDFGATPFDRTISRKYAGAKNEDGFVIVGCDNIALQKEIDLRIVGLTKNRHVGNEGFVLILDNSFDIISGPKDFPIKNFCRTDQQIELPDADVSFPITVNGIKYFSRYHISEGYYIFSFYPKEEAIQSKDVALYTNMFLQVIVYAVLFILIYLLIKRIVVNQIKKINGSLAKITDGNLDEVVDVRTNEEFESLSDDINSTVDTLKTYIAEAAARIDKELEFAKNIQVSALPSNFATVNNKGNAEIFASMNPAKEVGGDFYDFYFTEGNKLNFLIADVSGKGIPAAMFMMRAKTELKSLTESSFPINEVFTLGNAELCEGNDAGMFVTAWQGNIDLETGIVKFANAGHNPPVVKRNGKFEFLKSRVGFVLAGMEGIKYKAQEFKLEPGDVVYLYTDGVTEATNASEELYGDDRLLNILNSRNFENTEEICKAVKADVDAFVGDAPQFDDITMVAIKYIGMKK